MGPLFCCTPLFNTKSKFFLKPVSSQIGTHFMVGVGSNLRITIHRSVNTQRVNELTKECEMSLLMLIVDKKGYSTSMP